MQKYDQIPFSEQLTLTVPHWALELAAEHQICKDNESKMQLAVELARHNVLRDKGGPFGAAVFESETGRLISVGINRVTALGQSIAHAEIMAIALAQNTLHSFRLNSNGKRYTLATSAQPCAMCFGAIPWAGIDEVIIGARREDVESLTDFEEGPLHPDWIAQLQQRKISIVRDIGRETAREVLLQYKSSNGIPY